MFQYCPSVGVKVGLTFDMFSNVIFSMDNGRNFSLYENAQKGKVRSNQTIFGVLMKHFYKCDCLNVSGSWLFCTYRNFTWY